MSLADRAPVRKRVSWTPEQKAELVDRGARARMRGDTLGWLKLLKREQLHFEESQRRSLPNLGNEVWWRSGVEKRVLELRAEEAQKSHSKSLPPPSPKPPTRDEVIDSLTSTELTVALARYVVREIDAMHETVKDIHAYLRRIDHDFARWVEKEREEPLELEEAPRVGVGSLVESRRREESKTLVAVVGLKGEAVETVRRECSGDREVEVRFFPGDSRPKLPPSASYVLLGHATGSGWAEYAKQQLPKARLSYCNGGTGSVVTKIHEIGERVRKGFSG